MAVILQEILGDKLLVHEEGDKKHLFSPEEAKNKVLVKAKVIKDQQRREADLQSISNQLTTEPSHRKSKRRLLQPLKSCCDKLRCHLLQTQKKNRKRCYHSF
jgi:hypothetical protein